MISDETSWHVTMSSVYHQFATEKKIGRQHNVPGKKNLAVSTNRN